MDASAIEGIRGLAGERGGGGLEGGGFGRTPPLLLWPPMVPAKGGEFFFQLKFSRTEGAKENFEPVSLKQWKRRRGGGGMGLRGGGGADLVCKRGGVFWL